MEIVVNWLDIFSWKTQKKKNIKSQKYKIAENQVQVITYLYTIFILRDVEICRDVDSRIANKRGSSTDRRKYDFSLDSFLSFFYNIKIFDELVHK